VWLINVSKTGKTQVNGESIVEPTLMFHKDEFTVSTRNFRIRYEPDFEEFEEVGGRHHPPSCVALRAQLGLSTLRSPSQTPAPEDVLRMQSENTSSSGGGNDANIALSPRLVHAALRDAAPAAAPAAAAAFDARSCRW